LINKTSFTEISKNNQKKIILFGAGHIAKKTIRKIGKSKIEFIVDNSTNIHGTEYEGLLIHSPEKASDEYFIIICTTAISSVTTQLSSAGLKENVDFTISPVLNDLLAISELEQLNITFYFTSGSKQATNNNAPYGGGLYKCTLSGPEFKLERLYGGPCYSAIKKDESLIFVDTDKGLIRYQNEKFVNLLELPHGSRAHGLSYNESTKNYYVNCSNKDSILEISENFKILREFRISDKIDYTNEPMHHTNDNYSIGNSLYVSMFSSTGNWKQDVFDGCIAEFDIEKGVRKNDIKTGLYMPHNVNYYDGQLHILDSLPGHLLYNNLSIQGTFPAFTRGLDYHEGLYFIGQSKNRNYSKVMGVSNNISIDCGVIIFNTIIKASRFLQFPHAIGEIHAVVVME
jgi:hypothetical protein